LSYFEYEAIYLGIIVGLALANILASLHKLIEVGNRVRWGWMAPASAAYAATHTINEFWYTWIHQHDAAIRETAGNLTIFTWYPRALAFALLFLMCAAALPDDAAEGDVDLAHYYIENRKRFWGFSTALHALNLLNWLKAFALSGFGLQFLQSGTDARQCDGMRLESYTRVLAREMVARVGALGPMGVVVVFLRTDAAKLTST
jgi:hypothetical protein